MLSERQELERLEREIARLRVRIEAKEAAAQNDGGRVSEALKHTPSKEPKPTKSTAAFELNVATKWVSIAGAAVFVLGAVFFFQLAFSRGWISPLSRIGLGVAGGLILWGAGWGMHLRWKLGAYAQVVSGAGAALLYFTLYVAHQFPEYQALTGLSLHAGAILLGFVALGVLSDALVRPAKMIGFTAVLLVIITAIAANAWVEFGIIYITLMGIAVTAISRYRSWPDVEITTVCLLMVGLFVHTVIGNDPTWIIAATTVAVGTITAGAVFFRPASDEGTGSTMVVLQAVAWSVGLATILWNLGAYELSLRTGVSMVLGVGLLALSLTQVATQNERMTWRAVGTIALVVSPFFDLHGAWIVVAWAGLSITASVVNILQARQDMQFTVGAFSLITVGWLVFGPSPLDESLGLTVLRFIPAIAAMILAAYVDHRVEGGADGLAWANAVGALLVTLRLFSIVFDGLWVTASWTVLAIAVLAMGAALRQREIRLIGLATIVPVIGRLVFIDLNGVDIIWRVVAFLAVGVVLLAVSFVYAFVIRPKAHAIEAEAGE